MNTLWEIDEEVQDLEKALEQAGDDSSPLFEQYLENARGRLADKIDNIASLIKERQGRYGAIKEEADRMNALAASYARRAQRLRDYLQNWMERQDRKSFETQKFRVALRIAGGQPALKLPALIEEIPPAYLRTSEHVEPNKEAIRAALESGAEIPGCSLERKTLLVIK